MLVNKTPRTPLRPRLYKIAVSAGNCRQTCRIEAAIMKFSEFESSLDQKSPPASLQRALQALWWDAKGDWKTAHECAQADEGDPSCDWVHAYLHRKEGDVSNASYWYGQAGKPVARNALAEEWRSIVKALVGS
jgi:hypothetical protein